MNFEGHSKRILGEIPGEILFKIQRDFIGDVFGITLGEIFLGEFLEKFMDKLLNSRYFGEILVHIFGRFPGDISGRII